MLSVKDEEKSEHLFTADGSQQGNDYCENQY